MISARGLVHEFRAVRALAGIDLEIARGELFALIGPDGAGKSTFFRIAAGLVVPTAGTLALEPGATLGFVPQRFSLYEDLTIAENLWLRARLYGIAPGDARARSTELLERVGLGPFGRRQAGALSGGMKQKLALVAALLTRPALLLLDEPTTGVDPVSRREFWTLLAELHHGGVTIVVSTPYMDEAEYGTRIGFLDRGRLSALGTRREILAAYPRTLVEVRSPQRAGVRERLAARPEIDDVSPFGSRLHVRGARGVGSDLVERVRAALAGVVEPAAVRPLEPTLEDVFVLAGEPDAA